MLRWPSEWMMCSDEDGFQVGYEQCDGPGGVVLARHLGQHVDEVIVEVGILVQLLQPLLHLPLRRRVGALRLLNKYSFHTNIQEEM